MEGVLLVPPDRGAIIGRAMWKPRFVVVGPQTRGEKSLSTPRRMTISNGNTPQTSILYLTIYKSKTDVEPIQQHALSSITDCQVQVLAHKKQGQVAPTLVITLAPDPTTDKLRKRRSSRAAGLASSSSSKDNAANTLWFRTGDETLSLQDWERFIQSCMPKLPVPSGGVGPMSPMSPMMSPVSPTFTNPFGGSARSRDPSDYFPRPPSCSTPSQHASQLSRNAPLAHKNSTQSHPSRDRPMTYSGSPSLRSKRSDISSSHASIMNHSHHQSFNQQNTQYASMHPSDLPSPAATIPDHGLEFIEGWTAAQGRSSALNSPIRGRDSMSSQMTSPVPVAVPQPGTPSNVMVEAGSPPGPRETILDRAFQMRCIPGSENELPGEEKLSSLARFEALMREMDRKRESSRQSGVNQPRREPAAPRQLEQLPERSWDLDDNSSETSSYEEVDFPRSAGNGRPVGHSDRARHNHSQSFGQTSSQRTGFAHEMDLEEEDDLAIPPGTQRALEFIATGRSSPAIASSRSLASPKTSLEYAHGSEFRELPSVLGASDQVGRLHLGQGNNNNNNSNKQQPRSLQSSCAVTPTDHSAPTLLGMARRTNSEKRSSASSSKRISFTEQLTRRLSSTSSLLLQTNHDKTAPARASHDGESIMQQPSAPRSATSMPRGSHPASPPPPGMSEREWDKKCGWRGSVVIGNEGGFM